MNFFEKMFRGQEPPEDKTMDEEAEEFIKKLQAQGITDKDAKVIKVEGQNMTEKTEKMGAEAPEKRSYVSGKKNT